MRILIIHQHYLFPGQPGGSRFNEMGRLWAAAGHDVCVIASTLNYATGQRHPELGNRWCARVREGDVTVWRCYVPASYNSSTLGRMWAFFGFVLSSCWAALRVPRPDVVIASSPPLTLAIPGWVAARLRRQPAPWVFEIRDLWPESAISTGVLAERSLLTKILFKLERWACANATAVNALTPAFRENLIARGLAEASKILQIPNGADVSLFEGATRSEALRARLGWTDRVVALYAGAHGKANGIGQLVDAAEQLRDRHDILIATIGDGPERELWQNEARRRGLTNIVFHGAFPKEDMPQVLRSVDIGLAVLQRNPTFRTVYPNKVFDYMVSELPTVIAIDGIAKSLVCDVAQAGVFASPEDGRSLGAAIVSLADAPQRRSDLGRNGRAWVIHNAAREVLATRYLEHLTSLVAGRNPVAATSTASVS